MTNPAHFSSFGLGHSFVIRHSSFLSHLSPFVRLGALQPNFQLRLQIARGPIELRESPTILESQFPLRAADHAPSGQDEKGGRGRLNQAL